MKISVIGAGYMGLVTAATLSDLGHEVTCIESNSEKHEQLAAGVVPLFEPGLENLVRRALRERHLHFAPDIACVADARVAFIAVGTPCDHAGHADLSQVRAAALGIARALRGPTLVAVKSTVPPGTGRYLRSLIAAAAPPGAGFSFAANPEFLREGSAVHDSLHPSRIVIGVDEEGAADPLIELYEPLGCPLVVTDLNSAEMIKYASNCFLAVKISYINALADLCEKVDADVADVARGMGLDPRIGPHYLNAGLGFGGSCLPKDARALLALADLRGVGLSPIAAAVAINAARIPHFVTRISEAVGGLQERTVAVLGLSFKPDTDDLRDSPAVALAGALIAAGARVRAYDPAVAASALELPPEIMVCGTPYEAAQDAHCLALATEWAEFRDLDLPSIREVMSKPVIVDARNTLDADAVLAAGFEYHAAGRPRSRAAWNRRPAC